MTSADTGRLRSTRQGAALDAVLAEADGFLTAQALHDELRRRDQAIGLTTVYRHLKRLAEQGDVDVVVRPTVRRATAGAVGSPPGRLGPSPPPGLPAVAARSVEVAGPRSSAGQRVSPTTQGSPR